MRRQQLENNPERIEFFSFLSAVEELLVKPKDLKIQAFSISQS